MSIFECSGKLSMNCTIVSMKFRTALSREVDGGESGNGMLKLVSPWVGEWVEWIEDAKESVGLFSGPEWETVDETELS